MHKFYANAYLRIDSDPTLRSLVHGVLIKYDVVTINKYLENTFKEAVSQDCASFLMCAWRSSFNNTDFSNKLCILGRSYVENDEGKPLRFKRSSLRPLLKFGPAFSSPTLLSPYTPQSLACLASIVYCVMSNIGVNIGSVISREMHKFVMAKSSTNPPKPLGFPALITTIFAHQGLTISCPPLLNLR